jgi:protein-S-isoprenylcysteine O-methyltransferase Ste14
MAPGSSAVKAWPAIASLVPLTGTATAAAAPGTVEAEMTHVGTVLLLLLLGFACDAASAFTAAFSRRWGDRRGQWVTFILRNVLGIPVWVVGLGFAVRAPSPALFAAPAVVEVIGWALLAAGCVVQVLALVALRGRAARPSMADALVEHGVYAHIRHPIYAGLLLEFAALILVRPRRIVALACALGMLWVLLQARLEEVDLLQRMPAYRDYLGRVPRFIPRRRRTRPV